ncbi:MAG: hypothetical protein R3E65_00250 [Steroidobacteraceae bacterium]
MLGAIGALGLLAACTAARADPQYGERYTVWQAQLTTALTAQSDADSLVALALLRRSVTEPRYFTDATALDALNAAAAAAPENRAVAALRLQACLAAQGCDATEPAAHVQRIDPGNGIADFASLRSATQSGDATQIDAALASLANALAFNIYFNANTVAATDALSRTRLAAEPNQRRSGKAVEWLVAVTDGYSLYGTAAVEDIAKACRDPAATDARRANCLRTFATLQGSDAMVLQSVGANQTLRHAAPTIAAAAAARETRRRLDWYGESLAGAMKPWNFRQIPAALLAARRVHAREEDAQRALLAHLKVSAEPPADWKPLTEPVAGRD